MTVASRAWRGRAVVNGAASVSALRASIPDARALECLAGGTRSRVPPSLALGRRYAHAPAGALLTGLGTGELPPLRCG